MGHFSVKNARTLVVGEDFRLTDSAPDDTPEFTGDADDAVAEIAEITAELADL